jgi:hypothetical protein
MSQVQTTITNLPQAGPIQGTEAVPIVQNGVTKQTTTAAIAAAPSQFQTFLTINQEATLPNSRYLSTGTGLGLVDGGVQSYYRITLNGASGSLETVGDGFVVKDSGNSVINRTIQVSGNGLAITDGDGVAGNPVISLDGLSASLAGMSGSGLVTVLNGTTVTPRSILGTADQVLVTDGNGFAGSPTIGLADNPIIPGTGSMTIPIGTTAQQPAGSDGQLRYDSTVSAFYGFSSGSWKQFSLAGGVVQIDTGTGLTGGPITSVGTISIANTTVSAGSYGSATQVGTFTVNAQGQLTAAANVTITASAIGAVTSVSGTANEIDSTGGQTPVLSLPTALTFTGKTVTGGAFNMTSATVGSDTVTTNTASQTLTNKSISGSSNTLSNIGNASLTHSSVTYNGVNVALGAGGTITAVNPYALTIGTGLTGTSYDGSGNVTVAIDSTVATLTGVQTLTNKVIDGNNNTLSNIANSSLTNSSITLGTTNIALGATSLAPVGLTSVTVTQDPTTNLQLATKQYVDTVAATGIHYHEAVFVESPNTAGNLTSTYANGGTNANIIQIANGTDITFFGVSAAIGDQFLTSTGNGLLANTPYYIVADLGGNTYQISLTYGGSTVTGLTNGSVTLPSLINPGVGATLTNAGAQVALTIDSVLMTVGKRVLIYNQTNGFENGVYTVTVVGDGSTNWVLTRATDADTYSPYSANSLGQGDAFYVTNGATGAGETYVVTTTGTIFFGLTNINFAQISAAQVYSAGTGLTLTGTIFSITNTAVTAASYGSSSSVATFTVNAQGQLTAAATASISIDGNQITSGTVGSAYITGSYTGITGVGVLTAGTWNADTVGVGYGGTGLASYAAGDMIYATGTTTLAKLAIGATDYVLTSTGAAPQYVAQSTLSVGSATNATNAANVAVTVVATNASFYPAFVSATTGDLAVGVDADLTYNPSTNTLTAGTVTATTGIFGGTF